jgi:hypothetical protein
MSDNTPDGKAHQFLVSLYQHIEGDLQRAFSMYELGAAMGLARDEAGNLAQQLMASGHVEVRTLAGDIGLTKPGLDLVSVAQNGGDLPEQAVSLGNGELLSPQAVEAVDRLTTEIKANISTLCTDFEAMSQWTADLRCLQIQLSSPLPKTAVTRALLHSLTTMAETLTPAEATTAIQSKLSQLLAA